MASAQLSVSPEVLSWAVERSQKGSEVINSAFPKFQKWLNGESAPTMAELKKFAKAVYLPAPILLLPNPLSETMPIQDFRGKTKNTNPSPNLMDTVHTCLKRQEWYRQFINLSGENPLDFVDSATITENPKEVAGKIARLLKIETPLLKDLPRNDDGTKFVIELFEELGCLVIRNGVVANNTSRPLDVEEFRGFSISDPYAPLIFINGADAKSAQLFSLFHEFAHLLLGDSGISNSEFGDEKEAANERWCNEVASEVLVPSDDVKTHFDSEIELMQSLSLLQARYKVSREVIVRKLFTLSLISPSQFKKALAKLHEEYARMPRSSSSSGGNFYNNQPFKLSRSFALAVDQALSDGQILPTHALRLLDFKSFDIYDKTLERLKG